MPRRSSSSAKSVLVVRGYAQGGPDQQAKLRSVIEDDTPKLLRVDALNPITRAKIQAAIGLLTEVSRDMNNAPRANDYVRAMTRVQEAADRLLKSLPGAGTYLEDALQAEGYAPEDRFDTPTRFDLGQLGRQLAMLADAAKTVSAHYAIEPASKSKGRRKNVALYHCVSMLRAAFRDARTDRPTRCIRGAVAGLSDFERDEREFINAIIRAALGRGTDLPKDVFEATNPAEQ